MGCMGIGSWQAGSCSVGRAGRGKAVAREGCGQAGLWPGRAVAGPPGPCDGVHGHRKPASKVFLLRTGCAEDKSGALLNVTGHLPIE